jgi:hypothetical protein
MSTQKWHNLVFEKSNCYVFQATCILVDIPFNLIDKFSVYVTSNKVCIIQQEVELSSVWWCDRAARNVDARVTYVGDGEYTRSAGVTTVNAGSRELESPHWYHANTCLVTSMVTSHE